MFSSTVRSSTVRSATVAPPPRPGLPRLVYVLATGTFLMGTTEFMIAGLLPEIAGDLGVTQGRAGLSITVFALGMVLGAPGVPLLTLRLPPRTAMVVALGAYAAVHVVAAVTDSFLVLLLARLVAALATGAFWAIAAVAAAAAPGPGRSSGAIGIVLGGGMLANVLGVPLGSFVGQAIGWRAPFWSLAVLSALMVVLLLRSAPAASGSRTASFRSELASLRSGPLWAALLMGVCVSAGVMSVYSFISPVLTERAGVPASLVPLALLAYGVGTLIGNLLGGRLGDRQPYATMAVTTSASLAACVLLSLVSDRAAPAVVLFTLLGIVGLSANPILVALAVRFGGAGTTLPSGMATGMFNLGTAIGTALTGALLETPVGTLAPPLVGVGFGILVFAPLAAMVVAARGKARSPARPAATSSGS